MPSDFLKFDKRRKPDLPKPEKRKRASASQIRDIMIRQGGVCALCPAKLEERDQDRGFIRVCQPFQIDHIQRLDALGSQTTDNLQALCVPCHKAKTKVDNREAKKGARVRGDKGQLKRLREKGPVLKSRNSFAQPPLLSTRTSKDGKGWQKAEGYVSPLSKEGRRRMKERKRALQQGGGAA